MSIERINFRPALGDLVPVLERTLDAPALMAYGAATWDWHRLHYDLHYVNERGIAAPVVDGQLFGALCARAIVEWLGPKAFVASLKYKMRSMVFADDVVRISGTVSSVEPREHGLLICVEQQVHVGNRLAVEATTALRLRTDSA